MQVKLHGAFFCANAWASHHQPGFNLMPPLDVMTSLRCLSACGGGYQEIRPRHIPCDRLLAGSWSSIPLIHPPGIGGGGGGVAGGSSFASGDSPARKS